MKIPVSRTCVSTLRIIGRLNEHLLERSIEAVIHRHESLRTRFVEIDGLPYQVVNETSKFELPTLDASNEGSEDEALKLIGEFAAEKVSLEFGPLFGARLFRLSESDHILAYAVEHSVSDGTSLALIDTEIWTSYRQLSLGLPSHLPALPVQFGDFCIWQQENYLSWREEHLEYWKDLLADAPATRLPRARSSGEPGEHVSSELKYFPLGKALSDHLRCRAEECRAPLPWLLLAAYTVAMSRWCMQSDIVLLFVSHGRYTAELRPMVGLLASHVYFRFILKQGMTVAELIRQIKRQMFMAVEHEDFNRLPNFLSGWGTPHTDGYFNWLPNFGGQRAFDFGQTGEEEFELKPFTFRTPVSSGFMPLFSDTDEGITIIADYKPDIFPSVVVENFATEIKTIAEALARVPFSHTIESL